MGFAPQPVAPQDWKRYQKQMLTVFAIISFLIWIWLTLNHGGFWRASERLPLAQEPSETKSWPEIVAVIPARDEAETISDVISAHLSCNYAGKFSVILADDGSTDNTVEVAQATASAIVTRHKFEILSVPDLPHGWSGKLWAVHNGLEHASQISYEASYVLLTDADIAFAPDTLTRLVDKADSDDLALTSLMARLDSEGPWASFLIPAFVYFFQKLYPFPRVNDPSDNMAAAAGGCMLVQRSALTAIGGIKTIRGALIDDCSLARKIKDVTPSTRIWLGLAKDEAVSKRNNQSLSSIWDMIARTAYSQLRYSPLMLVGTLLGMVLTYLTAPLIVLTAFHHWNLFAVLFALPPCILMARTYWPTLVLYDRKPIEAFLLPVAASFYTAMTFSSAWRHWQGHGGRWKGRTYSDQN